MQLIYSTELSLFFNRIPEHINTFFASLHEFKISVVCSIRNRVLSFTAFPLVHLLELASSQMLFQQPILTIVQRGHGEEHVANGPKVLEHLSRHGYLFSHFQTVHHFPTCCILVMTSPYTSVNQPWIDQGKMFLRLRLNQPILCRIWFPKCLPLHINVSHELHLTLSCTIS